MGKLILFLLFVVAVYWWLRKQRPGDRREQAGATGEAAETMVSCHHCGLHVPLKESVAGNGRHYCSEEHRRLDAGSKRG